MPEPHPLPSYGEHMPLDVWWASCEFGCFNEYDGSGYFAYADSYDRALPVVFNRASFDEAVAGVEAKPTHVVWFNK